MRVDKVYVAVQGKWLLLCAATALQRKQPCCTTFLKQPTLQQNLISDIRMPKLDGFDLYRDIRKVDPNVRVALMTAFEIYKEELEKLFPTVGVRCFIKKPVRMDDLLSRINEELSAVA